MAYRKEIKKVLLKTQDGKEKSAQYKNGKIRTLSRTNPQTFLCSCKYDGKNRDTATEFKLEYKNRKMICPDCGKVIEIIKTWGEYQAEAEEKQQKRRENIHLSLVDKSFSSGMSYYALSTRIDYEDWKKISHLFENWSYIEDDDEQDTYGGSKLTGWLTTSPGEVEEILNVKPELRLDYRRKEAEKKQKEREELKKKQEELGKQINKAFEDAKKPWADENEKGTQGASMVEWPAGEVHEDPDYPFNIYGGGIRYVIDQKGNKIWKINNNGADGDNWGYNNVKTGGSGAIGVYVPYSVELEQLIKEYISLF